MQMCQSYVPLILVEVGGKYVNAPEDGYVNNKHCNSGTTTKIRATSTDSESFQFNNLVLSKT
jgi:hypothetical protein